MPKKLGEGHKIIHIDQGRIRRNFESGGREPVVMVYQPEQDNISHGHIVTIDGPSSVVYSPDKPCATGARVWVETYAAVEVAVLGEDDARDQTT